MKEITDQMALNCIDLALQKLRGVAWPHSMSLEEARSHIAARLRGEAQTGQEAVAEVFSSVRRDSGPKCSIQQVRLLRSVPDGTKLYARPQAALSSTAAPGGKHCQNGDADVCRASQRDGVICADDSCDINDGVRKPDAAPDPVAGDAAQHIAVLREIRSRYTESGSPARCAALDWAIGAIVQPDSVMRGALEELAQCDGSPNNVSDAEVLALRVRRLARAALAQDRASQAGAVPDAVREYLIVRPDGTRYLTDAGGADMARKRDGFRVYADVTRALAAQPSGGGVPECIEDAISLLTDFGRLDLVDAIREHYRAAAPAAPETGGEVR